MKNEIVLFKDGNIVLDVSVSPDCDTVWLNLDQIAILFEKNKSTISRHIKNIFEEEECDEKVVVANFATTTQHGALEGKTQTHNRQFYNLDVIISVGYRVKSKRGVAFRRWANLVLKDHIIKGYSINQNRLGQLQKVIEIIYRSSLPEVAGVSSILNHFTNGLKLLEGYDNQALNKNISNNVKANMIWRPTYNECCKIIESIDRVNKNSLFGNEKDNSFKSAITTIYQTFDGKEVYPSIQEKAANLLYFLVKDHAFTDGNKRIAAAIFICFLEKNGILLQSNGNMIIDNNTLAAMTLMIALSHPNEKDIICLLVINMLEGK